MTIHNHTLEDSVPQHEIPVEATVPNSASADSSAISFKVNRQTLIVSALAILLVISAFETIELSRLHQTLRTWQTLPAAVASTTATTTPTPAAGGGALPSQVGGC